MCDISSPIMKGGEQYDNKTKKQNLKEIYYSGLEGNNSFIVELFFRRIKD